MKQVESPSLLSSFYSAACVLNFSCFQLLAPSVKQWLSTELGINVSNTSEIKRHNNAVWVDDVILLAQGLKENGRCAIETLRLMDVHMGKDGASARCSAVSQH